LRDREENEPPLRGPILQKCSYFWAAGVIERLYLQKCSYFLPIPRKKAAFSKINVFLQDKWCRRASPPGITALLQLVQENGGRIGLTPALQRQSPPLLKEQSAAPTDMV
jgi:hypothetical protein